MPDQCSELVEISKLNGDFRRNYGKVLGAILYLRSVSAARGRSWFWAGLVSFVFRSRWLGWRGMAGRCEFRFDAPNKFVHSVCANGLVAGESPI